MKLRLVPLLLALTGVASHADDREPIFPDRPLEFALRFSHHNLEFAYGGGTRVDTEIDRVTLLWQERYGERLQLGLFAGYGSLTQTNNASTAGRELNGYHGGVTADLDIARFSCGNVFVSGDWLYQKLDHEQGTEKVVIVTREPNVRFGAGVTPVEEFRVYGGLRYGSIDGEQRLSGTVNETRKIKSARGTGGFAGADLLLPDGGYIRLTAESGSDRNVALWFGKRY